MGHTGDVIGTIGVERFMATVSIRNDGSGPVLQERCRMQTGTIVGIRDDAGRIGCISPKTTGVGPSLPGCRRLMMVSSMPITGLT